LTVHEYIIVAARIIKIRGMLLGLESLARPLLHISSQTKDQSITKNC
jgi:hypothetical protein